MTTIMCQVTGNISDLGLAAASGYVLRVVPEPRTAVVDGRTVTLADFSSVVVPATGLMQFTIPADRTFSLIPTINGQTLTAVQVRAPLRTSASLTSIVITTPPIPTSIQGLIDAVLTANQAVSESADRAESSALASQRWAEGTLPGGEGTRSARELADIARDWAESSTPPAGLGTKSAKTWAEEAEASASRIDLGDLDAAVFATSQDRVQTNLDRIAADADALQTAQDRLAVAADRTLTQAARDAALLSRGTFAGTAEGLSNGVVGVTGLVGGTGGANGTFALAFSGGAGTGAAGVFTVAGSAVTSVVVTNPGVGYTSAPTISFAASAGLTGASVTAQIGARNPVGTFFSVPASGNDSLILYRVDAGPVATEVARYPSAAAVAPLRVGSHMFDQSNPANYRAGRQYSPANAGIITSSAFRCSAFVPVTPGLTYTVFGIEPGMVVAAFDTAQDTGGNPVSVGTATPGWLTFTVPAGKNFVMWNITNDGQAVTTYDQCGIVPGASIPRSFAFRRGMEVSTLLSAPVLEAAVLEDYSFNMIDPSKVDFTRRYSTGTRTFIMKDSNLIARSDWIPVEEGAFYTVSGSGIFSVNVAPQGGFFTAWGATVAVQNITFAAPPTGGGRMFQVPVGLGITHVVISLATNAGGNALAGDAQMERGEVATAFQAYAATKKLRSGLERDTGGTGGGSGGSSGGSVSLNREAWFKFVEGDAGAHRIDGLPNFRETFHRRNADLPIVGVGTSLFARSTEHCTDHPQANSRPPLMHSNNAASLLWDHLVWEGQQYRRYDFPSFFAETGTFLTSHNLAEWDDGAYRNGLTRYSESAGAAVQFTVPAGAWAAGFIYRTDSVGCTATVTVGGGNGLLQAWNGSAWVEANGFSFSMNEPAPVTRTVNVPNPSTNALTPTVLASKGNTTYQKRLKLRARAVGGIDSRASAKTVTIARTGGGARFMYWGLEWSPREHMISFINAARGSHNTNALSATGLPRVQDNEVWEFNPRLILGELAIHNDGAAAANPVYRTGYWSTLANNYLFRSDYELSLIGSAARLGKAVPEMLIFHGTIAYNFGGIEEDGTLKFGDNTDGARQAMTALDRFAEAHDFIRKNHSDKAVSILTTQRWVEAGFAIYGGLKAATVGSGKAGNTFTNEGSHPNDTGCKVWMKPVLGVLNWMM